LARSGAHSIGVVSSNSTSQGERAVKYVLDGKVKTGRKEVNVRASNRARAQQLKLAAAQTINTAVEHID
jgi:hypothetical protein